MDRRNPGSRELGDRGISSYHLKLQKLKLFNNFQFCSHLSIVFFSYSFLRVEGNVHFERHTTFLPIIHQAKNVSLNLIFHDKYLLYTKVVSSQKSKESLREFLGSEM